MSKMQEHRRGWQLETVEQSQHAHAESLVGSAERQACGVAHGSGTVLRNPGATALGFPERDLDQFAPDVPTALAGSGADRLDFIVGPRTRIFRPKGRSPLSEIAGGTRGETRPSLGSAIVAALGDHISPRTDVVDQSQPSTRHAPLTDSPNNARYGW